MPKLAPFAIVCVLAFSASAFFSGGSSGDWLLDDNYVFPVDEGGGGMDIGDVVDQGTGVSTYEAQGQLSNFCFVCESPLGLIDQYSPIGYSAFSASNVTTFLGGQSVLSLEAKNFLSFAQTAIGLGGDPSSTAFTSFVKAGFYFDMDSLGPQSYFWTELDPLFLLRDPENFSSIEASNSDSIKVAGGLKAPDDKFANGLLEWKNLGEVLKLQQKANREFVTTHMPAVLASRYLVDGGLVSQGSAFLARVPSIEGGEQTVLITAAHNIFGTNAEKPDPILAEDQKRVVQFNGSFSNMPTSSFVPSNTIPGEETNRYNEPLDPGKDTAYMKFAHDPNLPVTLGNPSGLFPGQRLIVVGTTKMNGDTLFSFNVSEVTVKGFNANGEIVAEQIVIPNDPKHAIPLKPGWSGSGLFIPPNTVGNPTKDYVAVGVTTRAQVITDFNQTREVYFDPIFPNRCVPSGFSSFKPGAGC